MAKYRNKKAVRVVGDIYDFNRLNSIRHYSKVYFNNHSVGGTNPSLLKAMASEDFCFCNRRLRGSFGRRLRKDEEDRDGDKRG